MQVPTEILRKFRFLDGLPEEVLEDLAQIAVEEQYPDGALLFEEGTKAKCLYLILEGKVSLEKLVQLGRTGTARRATTGVISSWNPIGWSALVPPHVYTSSGVCFDKTRVDLRMGLLSDHPMVRHKKSRFLL